MEGTWVALSRFSPFPVGLKSGGLCQNIIFMFSRAEKNLLPSYVQLDGENVKCVSSPNIPFHPPENATGPKCSYEIHVYC